MGEFMEQNLGEDYFVVMDEGVQQRVLEPAKGRVRLDAADVNVQSLALERLGVSVRLFLGKVAAILEPADDRIPPRLRFEREFLRGMDVPDDESAV
jgi:hypothetical protein